jgi:hypothetical protein
MKYQSGRPGQEHHGDRREQHQQRGAEIRLQDDQRDRDRQDRDRRPDRAELRISPAAASRRSLRSAAR